MGTNYYLWTNEERPTEETIDGALHIGKNSAGWVFHFQSHPQVKSLKEMKEATQKGLIYNEYLEELSYNDFWDIVESTKEPFHGEEPYILVDPEHPNDNDFGSYEESGFAWTPVEFC